MRGIDYSIYQNDPEGYAHDVLGVTWHAQQLEIVRALLEHKRVFVRAGNGPGKTHVAGGLINWWYDCFNPGLCLTTAPTAQQVDDALWKEVRVQRKGRPGLQPKASRIEDAPNHYAVGYTASTGTSFQGRHERNVFIIFDEGTGVTFPYWESAEGMMNSENCMWLVLCNPTDTSSYAYEAEQSGRFHTVTLSALDHPNIIAERQQEPAPYPSAVRLQWVNDRVEEWCTPIEMHDRTAADILWNEKWYRPGPLFEARVLGRWPTAGSIAVWTEAMWERALLRQEENSLEPIEIGCDVARFGDDFTSIVVRRGNVVLHHETHNGWSTSQTAGRLKQLCQQYARIPEQVRQIAVKVDDDGVGGGVVDQASGYNFIPLSSASNAIEKNGYPNKRSELWFVVAKMADTGRLDLSRLSAHSQSLLRRQVMAPVWKLDSEGRRVVEPKSDTKKRIGRSPDDADALNLAFAVKPDRRGKSSVYTMSS